MNIRKYTNIEYVVANDEDRIIARCSQEKDAQLIAAAPDMYEVIINALVTFEILSHPFMEGHNVATNKELLEIMKKSFEDVLKKTGGDSGLERL